jgi:hypothetical protein
LAAQKALAALVKAQLFQIGHVKPRATPERAQYRHA